MKKVLPVLITIILIGVAGWGVYLLATKGTPDTKDDTADQTDGADTDDQADYSDITGFEECEAAGFPVQESYPERCTTPDGRSFTKSYDDNGISPVDDLTDDDTVPSETAYTLSALTAEAGAVAGEYEVSVKVTTAGTAESYAQGYTYEWKIDSSTALSKDRTSVTAGEYTHSPTLRTTRTNPTIKFVLTDPYTSKTVEISALLQDLLSL